MSIEVRTVFCDDIRREDNGKAILIGVYTGDLIPAHLPLQITMGFWIDIRGLAPGSHEVKIDVSFPGGAKLNLPGKVEVNDPIEPVSMMLAGLPANIKESGLVSVEIDIDGSRYFAGQLIVRPPLDSPKKT